MVLSHEDLRARHIFVAGEHSVGVHVSGFIDFGDWTPGPLVHDLAVLRVRGPELELGPVLVGSGQAGAGTFRRQLDLHTLFIAVGALAFQIAEQDRGDAAVTTDLIHELVGELTEQDR